MTRKNLYYGALVLGAAATLTLAVTLTVSISRSHRKPSPAANAPILAQATTSTATESKGGQKELIKVHGHWTIDVRNPDGTLVSHREFENALDPSGKVALTQVLGRLQKPGLWEITFYSLTTGYSIAEPADTSPIFAGHFSKNLEVCSGCTLGGVTANTSTLLLGGNVPVAADGEVSAVGTYLSYCAPTTTPTCATNLSKTQLTFVMLAPLVNGLCPPDTQCIVPVVAGQIIQVTVKISFS